MHTKEDKNARFLSILPTFDPSFPIEQKRLRDFSTFFQKGFEISPHLLYNKYE